MLTRANDVGVRRLDGRMTTAYDLLSFTTSTQELCLYCVFTASENFALLALIAPVCPCFINLVFTFCFICWFGNVSQKDKNKTQCVVNISSRITGFKQSFLTALQEKQVSRKANQNSNDNTHILYNEYVLLPSSRRFRTIICKTNRKRDSFIPMSVRLFNDKNL